jgi:hypothetical protein
VLAVLVVTALSLPFSKLGRPAGDEFGGDRLPLAIPKENVRGGLRRKPCRADVGGTGISFRGLDPDPRTFLSDLASMEEGLVEDMLRRAEEAALSFGALECERSVPPLPLDNVSQFCRSLCMAYSSLTGCLHPVVLL